MFGMDKKQKRLVLMSGILYFFCQLSRTDLSACFVDLLPDLGYTKDAVGIAITAGYISYAIGMLVNSLISDKTNPKVMICIATFTCAFTHLGIRMWPTIPVMIVMWSINGYVQSMIWPSLIQLMAGNMPVEQQDVALRVVSLFQHAGAICCYLIVPLEIAIGGWRVVMTCTAAFCLALGLIWLLARSLKGAAKQVKETITVSAKLNWKFFLTTRLSFFMILAVISGMLRDGITTWAPVYFSEQFSLTATLSVLLTALLPAAKIAAYAVNPVLKKKFPETRGLLMAAYASCVLIACLLLGMHLLGWSLAVAILMAVLLCFNGAGAICYVISFPLGFSSVGRAASVSGILDCMLYLGASIASYLYAFIAERGGWTATLCCWIVLPAIALVMVLTQRNLDPDISQLDIVSVETDRTE